MNNIKYYISHYPNDPKYWEVFTDMVDGVLISYKNLHTKKGNPTQLLQKMKKSKSVRHPLSIESHIPVTIDSGAYQFIDPECKKLTVRCEDILNTYIDIGVEKGVHLDWPVVDALSHYWKRKRLHVTEENAKKFIELNNGNNITIIGAVQGYGKNGKYKGYGKMAEKFINWGYEEIGIGGLAKLSRIYQNEVFLRTMDVIKILEEYEDIMLHVFGIGRMDILNKIAERYPNLTFDNATPTFSAIKREILFYNGVYKRYKIKKEKDMIEAKKLLEGCDCWACKKYGLEILKLGHRELNMARMIHNYYHYYKYVRSSIKDYL